MGDAECLVFEFAVAITDDHIVLFGVGDHGGHIDAEVVADAGDGARFVAWFGEKLETMLFRPGVGHFHAHFVPRPARFHAFGQDAVELKIGGVEQADGRGCRGGATATSVLLQHQQVEIPATVGDIGGAGQ